MNLNNATIHVTVGGQPRTSVHSDAAVNEEESAPRPVYTPPIDIHEEPDGLTLEADLPGATEQNLRIQLEDNVLSLYAKIDSPAPAGARVILEEHRAGDFQRSFILSDEVDRDRITADLMNGVLRLFLPKAERVRTRRIEIKT